MDRPPLKYTIKLADDKELEVKMSYGLFNDLQRVTPQPQHIVSTVLEDPWVRDYLVRRVMTNTNTMIDDEAKLIPIEETGIEDPAEVAALLEWVTGHLLYFFATSAGNISRLGQEFGNQIPKPQQPSKSGSPD